ncbi:metalloendopeptidase OMA1, mitochondrial isoform X2 [Gasterosteus aculeatus]
MMVLGVLRSFSLCAYRTRSFRFCCTPAGRPEPNSLRVPPARATRGVLFRSRPASLPGDGRTSPGPSPPVRGGHPFHTSPPLRALPAPLLWTLLKPAQKLVAIVLGRSIRKWWAALPADRRQLARQWVHRRRWHLAAGVSVATVMVAVFLLTHLDESPVTGRTRLLVFSRETHMELAALTSEAYMQEFAELLVPVGDPRHQVVERVVQHLAQRNEDLPEVSAVSWSVHVVQSPSINAFILPNGEVFIFTGMLEAVADVHQLTVVLGHEMAHAVLGHSAEQASLSHVVDLLSLVLLTTIWALCPRDSLALLGHWAQDKLSQEEMDQKLCVSLRRTESLPCFSSTSRHQGALQANATVCVCVSPGVCRCASRTRLLAANGDPRAADGRVLRPRVAVHSPVPQEPLHTAGQPPAAGAGVEGQLLLPGSARHRPARRLLQECARPAGNRQAQGGRRSRGVP